MQINCHHCQAEIPAEKIDFERRVATCAECGTILVIADQLVEPEPEWPDMLLPRGISVAHQEGELRISRRWLSSIHIGLAFFCLIWNGGLLYSTWSSSSIWLYLLTPHGWIGLACLYYVLSGFFNSTVIQINRERLSIRHRPFPSFGNKTLPVESIDQIYAREKREAKKNQVRYEVHFLNEAGQDKTLIKGLEEPLQALYLEEEIEHFLGIKDRKIQGELGASQGKVNWNAWRNVAEAHELTFAESKLLEGTRLSGLYGGYQLGLMVIRRGQPLKGQFATRLVVARTEELPVAVPLSSELPQMVNFFNEVHSKLSEAETLEVEEEGQRLVYEQPGILLKASQIQSLFKLSTRLLETYAQMMALGAEIIPVLQPIVATRDHRLRRVASQLIHEVGAATLPLKSQLSTLLCRRCLTRCTLHEVETSWFTAMSYYGCRVCHQSREFFKTHQVIAVLDSEMEEEIREEGDVLRVNWLKRREMFDFDRVEIVRATDEAVERFAVQVGNDTDPNRPRRAEEVPCQVAPDSGLSDNSLRILKQTFSDFRV